MKKRNQLTLKNKKSGKTKGCSEQTEQPDHDVSEKDSDTKEKLDNLKEKSKHNMMPLHFRI